MRRVAAVLVILAICASLYWLAVDRSGTRYITPLAASISEDGSELTVVVPHAGGCAEDHQFPKYWIDDGDLVVWVEERVGSFGCLVACLADEDFWCAEFLHTDLDPVVNPNTPIVFATPAPTAPVLAILTIILGASAALFLAGALRGRRRARPELVLYEPDSEQMGACPQDAGLGLDALDELE